MDVWILAIVAVSSFGLSFVSLYTYFKLGGIRIWRDDHNKPKPRKVLTGGGLPLITIATVIYIMFIFLFPDDSLLFLGIVLTTLIGMTFGLIDDFVDIRIWKKVPLMLIPPLPIVAIALAHPLWNHTEILWINFGILYWILVVPIVYMGFSNGANIIAGYDGLEGGIYILISLLYLLIGFMIQNDAVILISIVLLFALLAFEIFNIPPSKLLIGNVGSFPIGGLLGLIPLIGHFEIVLPIVFLPHLIEFMFKIKYRGHTSVFGVVDERGFIHNKDGIKSVLHWIISLGDMTENKITLTMLSIEALLCVVAFGIWFTTQYLY